MTHIDASTLAAYNSLVDPHLQSYFSNERIRSHLKNAGLIGGRGEIISDGEYRSRLARREHKKHVRHMLAENIVNQAIDMERARQARMRRDFEIVAKAAMVNNIKETKRRSGNLSGLMTNSVDMGLLSIDSSWPQTRPKSANYIQQTEISNEQTRIPRIQSAHVNDDHRGTYSSKSVHRRRRSLQRPKSSNINRSSSLQRPRSPAKHPDSSSPPCQITMVYYGPHTKVDYDHLVFEAIDEVMVMQQHCGGENLIVYKDMLKAGDEFTFNSRRHSDYPFGLSLYVKGLIDSRISTCCEYKHRHGVRLGGDRGHFAIRLVEGSKPCIKCRFEKQARLKKLAQSPKEKDGGNQNPITISISVSDEPKMKQTPVQIPVRHRSTSSKKDNYSDDFDASDKQKQPIRRRSSSDSTVTQSRQSSPKAAPRASAITQKQPARKFSSSSSDSSREEPIKKTWQIIFHTSNASLGETYPSKNISLKFSLIASNKNETETNEINMRQFTEKTVKQYSFPMKFKNIGKPEQIRLKMQITGDDDDDDDIKWRLDHIELIDPEVQSHLIFPCQQWIRPSQEKILKLSEESPRDERTRKTSSSTNDSKASSSNIKNRPQSPKVEQKAKKSSRSSTSSTSSRHSKTKFDTVHRQSPDNQKTTARSDVIDQENKIRYRVIIYPSLDDDGEFNPDRSSRIYLRLNNQSEETTLLRKSDHSCPQFESGENQTFEIDLIQNTNEKPKKLTIGYVNSDITGGKWKLHKIVLINIQTNEETIFPCKQTLIRNDLNHRAEQAFEAQVNQSDNESTPRNEKINSPKPNNDQKNKSRSPTPEKQPMNNIEKRKSVNGQKTKSRSPTPDKLQLNNIEKGKSPSFQEMNDEEADYKLIFKKLDPDNTLSLGSPPNSPRPKTRRGLQNQSEQENPNKLIEPLKGLDQLANQSARSNDQHNQNSLPPTTTDNDEDQFKRWYPTDDDDDTI